MEKTKREKKHEINLIVLGFLLTTLGGGILTFLYQWIQDNRRAQSDKMQAELNIMEQRRTQATALFNEISPLIDTRLYNWRRLAWGLEGSIPEDSLKARYTEYMHVFFEWNHNLNKNRALICRFFGPQLGEQFEEVIMPELRELHNTIISIYRTPRSFRHIIPSDSLNSLADPVNDVIYQFNNSMSELIRSGNVGLTDPGKACDIMVVDSIN